MRLVRGVRAGAGARGWCGRAGWCGCAAGAGAGRAAGAGLVAGGGRGYSRGPFPSQLLFLSLPFKPKSIYRAPSVHASDRVQY